MYGTSTAAVPQAQHKVMTFNLMSIAQHRTFSALRVLFFLFSFSVVFSMTLPIPVGAAAQASSAAPIKTGATPATVNDICAACIRGHMEFLASDALQGRGSSTHDELLAATYIASELRAYGIEPAGDDGGYIQKATLVKRTVSAPPELSFVAGGSTNGAATVWTHGKEMEVLNLSQTEFSGPLQKINLDGGVVKVQPGAVVFLTGNDDKKVRAARSEMFSQGAVAMLVAPSAAKKKSWQEDGKKLPEMPTLVEGSISGMTDSSNLLAVDDNAQEVLRKLADGTFLHFKAHAGSEEKSYTWNAVGILRGSDPSQRKNAILISAHLDHLGIGAPVNGDNIYNGADDDASGTIAVLELARVLGQGPKPRRTVIFALFGSEELGGLGSTYFREHPPLPLTDIAVNLEFEMIGRADSSVPHDTLWLTGWERSNLGAELAAHGAKLVADPHPEMSFFRRSDNYVLAKKGVVAQTVSSYGLHKDYHQPSDDLSHIDFQHMNAAIASLIGPMEWLVNADFRPQWNPGGKP
jgi:aminopeptidase YwaD